MIKSIKNNLVFKLIAFIFAVVIWILIINFNDPTETKTIKNIKIETINSDILKSKDKKFTLGNNGIVDIQVMGRKTLVSNLTDKDFVARADMSKLSITNTVEVNINPVRDMDIIVLNKTRLISVSIDNVIETVFPVTIKTLGEPKKGMAIGSAYAEPAQVSVVGAEKTIRSIKEIVGMINIQDATSDVTGFTDLEVYDYDGEIISNELVSIKNTRVYAKAEITRVKTVPITIVDIPRLNEAYSIEDIIISPMSINVVGNSEALTSTNSINISYSPEIFGSLIDSDVTNTLDIKKYLPEGISLVGDNNLVTIKIIIDKKFEKTLKIEPRDITIKNRALRSNYDIKNPIEIKIYGTKKALSKINEAKDLSPFIDVKDYIDGTYNVEVQFKPIIGIEFLNNKVELQVSGGS